MEDERDVVIQAGRDEKVQVRKAKRRAFGLAKQKRFLAHFAATCNVRASAAAAEVSVSAVYKVRARNAAFQAQWERAQELGYMTLEAALLQRAIKSVQEILPDEAALDENDRVPFKDAMQLLQAHGRSRGRKPGEVHPQRSDIADATRRLEKILKGLNIEPVTEDGTQGEVASGE